MTEQADLRVKDLLDKRNIKYDIDHNGDFRVHSEPENDPPHDVYMHSGTNYFAGRELRDIWAVAFTTDGPIFPEISDMLLYKNGSCITGSWGLLVSDKQCAVVFKIQISADADENELFTAMQGVMTQVREIEDMFFGA